MGFPDSAANLAPVAAISVESLKRTLKLRSKPKGRSVDPEALVEVQRLLGDAPRRRDLLIEHLHRLQDGLGHTPATHLVALAREMNLPYAEVYEVATFYHHFDVVKEGDTVPPAITVRVCDSLSCELAGAKDLLAKLPAILGSEVRVIPTPCIGRCEQAPAVAVGQNPLACATVAAVEMAVKAKAVTHRRAAPGVAFEPVSFADSATSPGVQTDVAPPVTDFEAYRKAGGYALAAGCFAGQQTSDGLIDIMEQSGLRGLGGAGFPAGRKWRIVRGETAPKVMAVNIDEGEPGTFKDRTYLERDPHRFLEGALVAAWVTGVGAIYIYLRDEYHGCRAILEEAVAALKANPPCPLPHIEVRRGAGAYICGEESAMIESIEGKRGEPRMRPPYIAQVGLFGYPTLEHNFETLYWVREIVQRGPAWFAGFGRNGRKGLRSFSVSGRVVKPGVHLAPAGITVRELIAEYCGGMLAGHDLYGYLPGGASGGILPASLGDVPLDFDTLQPHGSFIGSAAVIVLSQHDKARDAALNVMRFFKHESCGQCTPCRVGTAKAATLMESAVWDQTLLEDLSQVMGEASICGLGQAAPNPIRTVVKYFHDEIA